MIFLFLCAALWALSFLLAIAVKNNAMRRLLGVALPLCGIGVMLFFGAQLQPWQRLIASCLVLLYLIKSTALLFQPRDKVLSLDRLGLTLYFTLWPGIDPAPFERRVVNEPEDVRMIRGAVFAAMGIG
jgi:hypothetical protein